MQETSIVRKIIFITVSFVLGRVTNSILPCHLWRAIAISKENTGTYFKIGHGRYLSNSLRFNIQEPDSQHLKASFNKPSCNESL
jgi:hypothetical protein